MSQRTLLFYVHALAGGGAELVVARLASGFAARGDRVLLVVESEADEWRRTLDERVEYIVLPHGRLRGVLALARLLAREKPFASYSALAATNLRHWVAALLSGRGRFAILAYHGFLENEPQLLSRLGFLLAPVMLRFAGAGVAVSDVLRQDLIDRLHCPPRAVVTMYNPAAPRVPQPPLTPHALAARAPLVVAAGRLVPEKGFSTLVGAFARVSTPDARLAILGKGPQLEELEAQARSLGLADRVEFPGYVDPNSHFLRARCFVSPSFHESFGLVIVEALDHGLPVVATMSGGPQEILNRRELGRLVAAGEEAEMAEAIQASLEAPGDPAPRQRRATDFSLESSLDAHEWLFLRMRAKRERGTP